MAQSSPWLTLTEAAARLRISEHEVLQLAVSGQVRSRLVHDHRELCAAAVEEFASELAARGGDDLTEHANRPAFTPWTAADDPEAFADRGDYDDTPNDEGDETP